MVDRRRGSLPIPGRREYARDVSGVLHDPRSSALGLHSRLSSRQSSKVDLVRATTARRGDVSSLTMIPRRRRSMADGMGGIGVSGSAAAVGS